MLLHIGLDTVNLEGEGFRLQVAEGDVINQNEVLVELDTEKIKAKGYSLMTLDFQRIWIRTVTMYSWKKIR